MLSLIRRSRRPAALVLALVLLSLLAWRILYKRKLKEPREAVYEIVS